MLKYWNVGKLKKWKVISEVVNGYVVMRCPAGKEKGKSKKLGSFSRERRSESAKERKGEVKSGKWHSYVDLLKNVFKPRPQRKKCWDQNQGLVRRRSSDWLWGNHSAALSLDEGRSAFLFAALTFWFFCVKTKEQNKIPKLQTSGNILWNRIIPDYPCISRQTSKKGGQARIKPVGHTKIAGIGNLFPCGEKIN